MESNMGEKLMEIISKIGAESVGGEENFRKKI